MIVQCKDELLEKRIIDFIADDYLNCLYLYVNLKKYSFKSETVSVFAQIKNEHIVSVILKYHSCIHIYNKDIQTLPELIQKVFELQPKMLVANKNTIIEIEKLLTGCKYEKEYGYTLKFESNVPQAGLLGERVSVDKLEKISEFLYKDEVFNKSYSTREDLEKEIRERNITNYSRNYCIVKENEIAAHISTGAELSNLASLTGFVVDKNLRGMGYGKNIILSICRDLRTEGKEVYSLVYEEKSLNLHKSVGFSVISEIGRIIF